MGKELEYAGSDLSERMRYAATIASAGDLIPRTLWGAPTPKPEGGMNPPAPSQGKVLLVMETGAMLGIHPVAALQGVHVIEGKATLSPALMSAVVRRAGHKLRVRLEGTVASGDIRAVASLVRVDDPDNPFEAVWDLDRARRAGLYPESNPKKPWNAYTEAMLKARAISEVCREGATDVLMGAGYVPEELGAQVNAEGEVIDLGHQEPMRDPAPAPTPSAPTPEQNAPETPTQPQGERLPADAYDLAAIGTAEQARAVYVAARRAGHLGHLIMGKDGPRPFGEWLVEYGKYLAEQEEASRLDGTDPDEAPAADPQTGEIVDYAPALEAATTADEVRALYMDAEANNALTTDLRVAMTERLEELTVAERAAEAAPDAEADA